MDDLEAIKKGTYRHSDRLEYVAKGRDPTRTGPETQNQKKGRDHEDYDWYQGHGPKGFDPDDYKDNVDLPNWCQLPEEILIDQGVMAVCEDIGRGPHTLMDRYLIRCMCQIVVPIYRSFHQTKVSDSKCKFMQKRMDVL